MLTWSVVEASELAVGKTTMLRQTFFFLKVFVLLVSTLLQGWRNSLLTYGPSCRPSCTHSTRAGGQESDWELHGLRVRVGALRTTPNPSPELEHFWVLRGLVDRLLTFYGIYCKYLLT